MVTGINISGDPGDRTKDVTALADGIEKIIQAGGDREVTLRALAAFEQATRINNTVQNCHFVVHDTL